ncbi:MULTISPECIES: GNAT family N-acetyltransferase [unclassified Microbacterium]|uniref:GNAT family N-acetyltransferase n=1 Tax=unclassified Microbacterium TaxID=2609290 RepID=UPI000EA8BCBA|nr:MULTISPECIES: GNAT family N-acetyltransferase [unclassified Microbacterium]MBT2484517.1 N-acetyltransferase [Microbacterium sp. ISL-108]RKN67419.1 N-acetyltransferase [Microbacterium sp. CGR2]
MTDITVTRNDDASRYEIRADGVLAGFAAFDIRPGAIRFIHTEVDEAFQGQGLASRLAFDALTDAAASGAAIVPLCPYIAKYLETHEIAGAEIRRRTSNGSATSTHTDAASRSEDGSTAPSSAS